MTFLFLSGALWALSFILVLFVKNNTLRRGCAALLPLCGIGAMVVFGAQMEPWQRLIISCLVLLYLIKASTLLLWPRDKVLQLDKLGLLIYFTFWPGVDAKPFEQRTATKPEDVRMIRGAVFAAIGFGLGILTALATPFFPPSTIGTFGISAFLICLHFGFSDVLTFVVQTIGFPVAPLFDEPWKSRSLRDFWSRRWNRAFVEMDTILFWPILRKHLSTRGALFGVFILSGLLHEGGLSYPAWGGWGAPLVYFALHGLLVSCEVRWRVEKKWPLWISRLWTYFWVLAPLPLLFHLPFRETVVAPLFAALHGVIALPLEWWFSLALRLAAIGHGCILMASFQVPSRLGWREDLQKLTPFNRKVMWTYGAFIVMLIISLSLLTWYLHAEMLRGDRAALALALLIGVFWGARIIVDFFYFEQKDWPRGPLFVMGHVLLTGLFMALASTYLGLVIWHNIG